MPRCTSLTDKWASKLKALSDTRRRGPINGPQTTDLTYRAEIIVAVPIKVVNPIPMHWAAGPLRMTWRTGLKRVESTATTRTYYLSPEVGRTLFSDRGMTLRWHQMQPNGPTITAAARITASEVLIRRKARSRVAAGPAIAVLHISTTNVTAAEVAELLYVVTDFHSTHGTKMRALLKTVLPFAESTGDLRRTQTVTLIRPLEQLGWAYSTAEHPPEPAIEWVHLLTNQGRTPPDVGALIDGAAFSLVKPSGDYVLGVGRFGVGLVARHSDQTLGEALTFFTHTIYADLLMFHASKLLSIQELERRTAEVVEHVRSRTLASLRQDLIRFRAWYLPQEFSTQSPYDSALRLLDREAKIADRLVAVREDMGELHDRLQTNASLATAVIVGAIAVVGLPATLSISLWQGLIANGKLNDLVLPAILLYAIIVLPAWFIIPKRLRDSIFGGWSHPDDS